MSVRRLIVGNWKMNGLSHDGPMLAADIARRTGELGPSAPEIVVCPPATLLGAAIAAVRDSPVRVGGQDCHTAASGAHTGDISALMLADIGCRYVIVGHSERRQNHRETDAEVAAKATRAHAAGLSAIVCVGESWDEREAGRTFEVVASQLAGSLPLFLSAAGNTVVAYEPVWAIGTGRTATPAQAGEVHALIRRELAARDVTDAKNVRILYGGSVKASNAAELLAVANIDGALVGGASLNADEFLAIAAAAMAAG